MTQRWVLIDFETASACELKKAGAYVYAADPTTEITALAYVASDGRSGRLSPDLLAGEERLRELCADPSVLFIAHNAAFERAVWREVMCGVYGWPDIPVERWHDTMAVALQKGLPAKLDKLAQAIRLPIEKDMVGSKLAISLSKPNKKTGMLDRSPETMQRVLDYCAQDVLVEEKVLRFVKTFQGDERCVWDLDQRINDRGIKLDKKFIQAGMRILERTIPEVVLRFKALTAGKLFPDGIAPTQGEKFKEWLKVEGLDLPSLNKETVSRLLGKQDEDEDDDTGEDLSTDDGAPGPGAIPDNCRRALLLRGLAASASVKKLPAMLSCQGSDGRARGLLQYHGAGPGRWAGRILQPHNFPRAGVSTGLDANGRETTASPGDVVAAILGEDVGFIRAVFGEPVEVISAGLRHALVADASLTFGIADFAQIEARVVLALAGQHDAVQAFVTGKPYIAMAERIFKHPVDKHANLLEYTIGKFTILGSGFGMGKHTFQRRYAPNESLEFCETAINTYRKDFAPKVPDLWYALERASTRTVWDGTANETHGILYQMEGPWLTCRLPSGRKLFYFEPKRESRPMPWDKDDIRPSWSSMTFKAGHWFRRDMYGGLLTENVVQGMARDLLVHAMFNCEREGLPIVLTVHDEVVVETEEHRLRGLDQLMIDRPAWAVEYGIPVAVETMISDRYRK